MRVMLVGDSWGCGEWNFNSSGILHPGLEQYLREDGHEVHNISRGSISNLDIVHRISDYYQRHNKQSLDLILVFQTEYSRDFKHNKMQEDFGVNDWENLKEIKDLQNQWIERFYFRLSEISIRFSVPIKIIGGCSDTIYFDDMSKDYPGCDIVCQSFTNLILFDDDRISDPVFSWYSKSSADLVEKLYKILPMESVNNLVNEIDRGFERECLLKENPTFFYPDGKHPNRIGHRILFDFLKSQKILD